MGLLPLEFTDCLTDSPYFRENLHAHEKELDRTSTDIKLLIKEVKELLAATRALSKAQRAVAETLMKFKFECIGSSLTDDEIIISQSLKEFGRLVSAIEDERDRMLERAIDQFIVPLENFRKEHIGNVKEGKKKFDKQTNKYYQSQERYLNLSCRKQDVVLQEADASVEFEQRHFYQASLEYVFLLQEVQERKKFELVETVRSKIWLTFYHQGHEVAKDFKPYMVDVQVRVQRAEHLMQKMLEVRKTLAGKITSTETLVVRSCQRTDNPERRFCFDIIADDRPGVVFTLQAMSEEDRNLWLEAMTDQEVSGITLPKNLASEGISLDEIGFKFIRRCITELERRGLEEQGLYRVVGVSSKVKKLLALGLSKTHCDTLSLTSCLNWESKTITSAVKQFFRNLPEPLLTYRLYNQFLEAAKLEDKLQRIYEIHHLVYHLPQANWDMLKLLQNHLNRVASLSERNLMSVGNLAVCFGPTILRPEEETVAAIMEIKFCNTVVELIIENCDKIFDSSPAETPRRARCTAPVTHAVVTTYNDGPRSIVMCHTPDQSPDFSLETQLRINGDKDSADVNPHSSRLSRIPGESYYAPTYRSPKCVGLFSLRRVRTLYACVAESDSELSFDSNQIITNVRPSGEPRWLTGTLNGKSGLIPENYVEYLP